jgi:hypothetical protein
MSDRPGTVWCPGLFRLHPPPRKGTPMAIQLEANYSKKLGLPGYSSHQYSVTLRLEVGDIKQVEAESARLYALLQGCVDRDIQEAGFLPVQGSSNGNGASNGSHQNGSNGHSHGHANGHSNGHHGTNGNGRPNGQSEAWACSDKQRSLILKIVEDHRVAEPSARRALSPGDPRSPAGEDPRRRHRAEQGRASGARSSGRRPEGGARPVDRGQ